MSQVGNEYRVHLDAFEGPLDLLLHLIRRAEVDVTDIPIASITDQYLSFLSGIERVDLELAGEFLLMAATLMEIKSRMVAPTTEAGESGGERSERDEGDPRSDLVRQLLEYKKYRDAADALERKREDWERRFPSSPATYDKEAVGEAIERLNDVELEDLELVDLVEAFKKIYESVNFDRIGEHQVVDDDTPIELHAADLVDQLSRDADGEAGVPLVRIFQGRSRGEMIGLFLAMLELVRQRRIGVRQDAATSSIVVRLREEEPEETLAVEAESEED